jgi:hypothetical protein
MPTPQHLLLLSEMSDKKNSINHQRRLVLEIKKTGMIVFLQEQKYLVEVLIVISLVCYEDLQ